MDDIGKTPFSKYTYFLSECRAMRWANTKVRFSYLLGVGGIELKGYQFRDDQVKDFDLFNISNVRQNRKVDRVKFYELYRATNYNNFLVFKYSPDLIGLKA